jgi:hypothetical protein
MFFLCLFILPVLFLYVLENIAHKCVQIAQSEMIGVFTGRRIIQKQKSYAMYHPGLQHIAQVLYLISIILSTLR